MADVQTSEVDAKLAQSTWNKFCVLRDLQMINEFYMTIFVKKQNTNMAGC
jgi:hypothetical protein